MRVLLAAACVLLVGCGGGGGSTSTPGGIGNAVVTINWPSRSRLVPVAAESVRVTFKRGDEQLATHLFVRPAAGGSSTATIEGIRSGSVTLFASAYPTSGGTGVAQASGQTPVDVVPNQTTPIAIRMDSTIARIDLGVAGGSAILPGGTAQLTVTARDASNAIVLISPKTLAWSSSNSAYAWVDADGRVTAVKPTGVTPGPVDVSVRESESGKSGVARIEVRSNAAVSISPNPTSVRAGAKKTFTAAVTNAPDTTVTWSVQEGAAGGTITAAGEYTAPGTAGTYHVVATSRWDNSKKATATVNVSASGALVTITPSRTWLGVGEKLQFTATVDGTANQAVTWSIQEGVAGGTITAAGLYSTPTKGGDYHVVATSVAEPAAKAVALVTVEEPPPPPF